MDAGFVGMRRLALVAVTQIAPDFVEGPSRAWTPGSEGRWGVRLSVGRGEYRRAAQSGALFSARFAPITVQAPLEVGAGRLPRRKSRSLR